MVVVALVAYIVTILLIISFIKNMYTKLRIFVGTLSVFVLPFLASAQAEPGSQVTGLITVFGEWVNTLIPIALALGLLFFLYAIVKFLLSAGDEEKRKDAKSMMIWGVIALFVMVSVWGLVGFIGNTFGVSQGGGIGAPEVPAFQQ